MFLFCASRPFTMDSFLIYKMVYCKNEKVVLCIDKATYQDCNLIPYMDNLKKDNIFYDVIYINMVVVPRKSRTECQDHEQFSEWFTEQYDFQFSKFGYKISEFEKIVVFNEINGAEINLYFNLNKINYFWFQIGKNTLWDRSVTWYTPYMNEVMNQYKAPAGIASYAIPILRKDSEKSIKALQSLDRKYCIWDSVNDIRKLENETLEQIMKCFLFNISDIKESISIILLNNYGMFRNRLGYGGWLTMKKRMLAGEDPLLYRLGFLDATLDEVFAGHFARMIDYYCSEKQIYVKNHPANFLESDRIKDLYGENIKKLSDTPMQFITEYFRRNKMRFKQVIGAESSAFMEMNDSTCEEIWKLGTNYFTTWFYYDTLYVLSEIFQNSILHRTQIYAPNYAASQINLLCKKRKSDVRVVSYVKMTELLSLKGSMIVIDAYKCNIEECMDAINKISCYNTILFINVEISNTIKTNILFQLSIPIQIRKYPLNYRRSPVFLENDEIIWVYARDVDVRSELRQFSLDRQLKYSQVRLHVEPAASINREIELRNQQEIHFLKSQNTQLVEQCRNLEKTLFLTKSLTMPNLHDSNAKKRLRNEQTINGWMEILDVIFNQCIVILAVKDTPGDFMPLDILEKIYGFGFSNFKTKLWQTYIGFSGNGKIVVDQLGESPEMPLRVQVKNGDDHVLIASASWKYGNRAAIIINGVDYAVNARGINIVVYNERTRGVIDSIAYDAHINGNRKIQHKMNLS